MLRNFLRRSILTAFDLTAGLAFVVLVVSCIALGQVLMEGLPDWDFSVNFAVWTSTLTAAIVWIYYFSAVRDRVRSYIWKEI